MDEIFQFQSFGKALGPLDVGVVVGAIGLLFVIAYVSGRKEADTRDFFLGGRRVPALVACLSFVATEVSAVTIIGVPATGFSENWQYLQFYIGSAAAKLFVALLFIPVFYKFDCTTIYEFLRHRFGIETQRAGSVFFLITRLLASGVRLYAACLGVSVILGLPLAMTLVLFTVFSIAFIAFGGIKAVVWTGAYETVFFYVAGGAVVAYLLGQIHGGFGEAMRVAWDAGRLSVFNFKLDLNQSTTFWAGATNAFFVGVAMFGTDQEMVQRLLTVKTRRASQKAIVGTIAAALPVTFTYLLIGTLLFVFYRQNPALAQAKEVKDVFQHFVANYLPMGLRGLVLAAIILASIDSPLSSLSSSFVTDLYRPLRKGASERHYLWVSRAGVVGAGIALAGIALACQSVSSILWFAFKIIAVTGGATLGIFLLGLLTRGGHYPHNVVAMVLSTLAMLVLLLWSEFGIIPLAWTWLIVLGTFLTMALAWLLGPAIHNRQQAAGNRH